jgi:hypothetical protein
MKRPPKARLRERDGRALSSYARADKLPCRYDPHESVPSQLETAPRWRKPRATKPFRTAPRSK